MPFGVRNIGWDIRKNRVQAFSLLAKGVWQIDNDGNSLYERYFPLK